MYLHRFLLMIIPCLFFMSVCSASAQSARNFGEFGRGERSHQKVFGQHGADRRFDAQHTASGEKTARIKRTAPEGVLGSASARPARANEEKGRERKMGEREKVVAGGSLIDKRHFTLFPEEEGEDRGKMERREKRPHRDEREDRRPRSDYDRSWRRDGGQYREWTGHPRSEPVRHVIHRLPPRHTIIAHGKDKYHYHAGRFYRPWGSGFILTQPPFGLVVFEIPSTFRAVVSSGVTYYVVGDVYYRRTGAGYEVSRPVGIGASGLDRVVVQTELLNVRYGPDLDEPVVAQVEYGEMLYVKGAVSGWLRVENSGGTVRGWVMEEFVGSARARG